MSTSRDANLLKIFKILLLVVPRDSPRFDSQIFNKIEQEPSALTRWGGALEDDDGDNNGGVLYDGNKRSAANRISVLQRWDMTCPLATGQVEDKPR